VFTFKVHPAAITVTEGIQHAFEYLVSTWRTWLPIVLVVAAANFVLYLVVFDIAGDGLYYVDQWTGEVHTAPDAGDRLLRMVPAVLLYAAVLAVSGWAFTGMAVAGLRGWKLTASVVLTRGLVSLVADLLIVAACFAVGLAWVIVTVAVPPIGILAFFVLIPVAVYAWIRITFVTLAVFDGFGPVGGLQESWRLSEGAVLRMFGWGLMAGLISGGVSMIASQGTGFMPSADSGSLAVVGGVTGGLSAVVSVFSTFFMAVLYESQRARHDPNLYPVPAYSYPSPPAYPGFVPPGSYPPPSYPATQQGGPSWGDGQPDGPAEGPAAGAPPTWPPRSS
jgi:hypothetical protein